MRSASVRARTGLPSGSTLSRSPGPSGRGSAAGFCARTTRSSLSPATVCASFRRAPAATSTRCSSRQRSPLRRNGHVARVELGDRQPDLTTAKAQALGITRKLVSYTTQMGVSSSNRIHNVHLMADFIDGTVVAPGEKFSFNDVVGPRTAERGFLEGQEIIGSLVLPSIGGGVCQTATTLFNDAFELGLPILARTNHNLYLAHYPIGRDATVAWGGPDFQFKNDLKHGLLIKTTYSDQTLTFTFYGTSEGRRVVSHTGAQTNWTKPSMNYAIDPNAPRGSAKVVAGTGELGFDVVVDRTVYDAQRQEASKRRVQVALHPGQPDDGLRPRPHPARAVHRPPDVDLNDVREPTHGSVVTLSSRRLPTMGRSCAGSAQRPPGRLVRSGLQAYPCF